MQSCHSLFRGICFLFLLTVLSGCVAGARSAVRDGDEVFVRLTCRMPDGKIIMSTEKNEDVAAISPLYVPGNESRPLRLIAGKDVEGRGVRGDFDVELANRAARSVVGMTYGETKRVTFTADPVPGADGKPRQLPMARVRQRPRQLEMSRAEYANRFGKSPEIGQKVFLSSGIPGMVTGIVDSNVTIKGMAVSGSEIVTPFGSGIISEKDDRYEIEIDAKVGTITRSGPLLGRIISVNDRMFIIDYTQPFAGEALSCHLQALEAAELATTQNILHDKTTE
jgi:hypothetical protein